MCMKINEILNKFLLVGDKFMPEIWLQPGFTYSASSPFTRNKERIENWKMQTGNTDFIYRNELDLFST